MQLYQDGELAGSMTMPSPPLHRPGKVFVGLPRHPMSQLGFNEGFEGKIADMRYHSHALPQEQVRAMHKARPVTELADEYCFQIVSMLRSVLPSMPLLHARSSRSPGAAPEAGRSSASTPWVRRLVVPTIG